MKIYAVYKSNESNEAMHPLLAAFAPSMRGVRTMLRVRTMLTGRYGEPDLGRILIVNRCQLTPVTRKPFEKAFASIAKDFENTKKSMEGCNCSDCVLSSMTSNIYPL